MDIFWIRVVSQLGIYATFVACFAWAMRRGAREWVPLIGTVIYAVVFEHLNMLRYADVRGGYFYHAQSWLWIANDVPLYIPLAWAFIVATSREITDSLRLRAWARPFCDALLALLIDLSLDTVAIRLKFWTWRGIGWNEGFFGVPADNFLGWLLVTFTFSLLTRQLWRTSSPAISASETRPSVTRRRLQTKCILQWLVLPPLAYLLYLVLEAFVHVGYRLTGSSSLESQLYVLAAVVLLFVAVTFSGAKQPLEAAIEEATSRQTGRLWRHLQTHGPRHFFHIFGVIGLFFVPAALRAPSLWGLALMVWTVEGLIAWRVSRLEAARLIIPAPNAYTEEIKLS